MEQNVDPTPEEVAPMPASAPVPAAPVLVQQIAYHREAESLAAWARVVRAFGVVATVVGAAGVVQFCLNMLPVLGLPRMLPTGAPRGPSVLTVVPLVLLLVGGIGCATLRGFGRPTLIAYAVCALAITGLMHSANFLSVPASRPMSRTVGYMAYFTLVLIQSAALPLVTLILMRQPDVRRLLQNR